MTNYFPKERVPKYWKRCCICKNIPDEIVNDWPTTWLSLLPCTFCPPCYHKYVLAPKGRINWALFSVVLLTATVLLTLTALLVLFIYSVIQ